MITEDYVSLEVAKLLKEKGFDCSSYSHYRLDNGELCRFNTNCSTNFHKQNDYVTAPTLQMAMKWLRETFEIHCQIDCPIVASNWRYGIRDLNKDEWVTLRNMGDYETYEEACESAIKYCLENLV